MSQMFPMPIHGEIRELSFSEEAYSEGGERKTRTIYTICFRMDERTKLVMESGAHVSEHEIELTLFSSPEKWKALSEEIGDEWIGFLSCSKEKNGGFHIFGAACWPGSAESMLALRGGGANISMYIGNVEVIADYGPPHKWFTGRDGALLISSIKVSGRG